MLNLVLHLHTCWNTTTTPDLKIASTRHGHWLIICGGEFSIIQLSKPDGSQLSYYPSRPNAAGPRNQSVSVSVSVELVCHLSSLQRENVGLNSLRPLHTGSVKVSLHMRIDYRRLSAHRIQGLPLTVPVTWVFLFFFTMVSYQSMQSRFADCLFQLTADGFNVM